MPSPFPGMDPYLENPTYWPDYRNTFLSSWCDVLLDHLPQSYDASICQHTYLTDTPVSDSVDPDLIITDRPRSALSTPPPGAFIVEPVTMKLLTFEEEHEAYIEIVHLPERSLVTVLELLSPATKETNRRGSYLTMRHEIFLRQVHFLELDLLRAGPRTFNDDHISPCHYCALVSRWEQRWTGQVYGWNLHQPLPRLPIPLRAPDDDITIDLQAVFTRAYEIGQFDQRVNYGESPPDPVADFERTWIRERVQTR